MAVYFIDYENVNTDGLNGISKLTNNDQVVIFYSDKADRLTFGLHRRLNECKAAIDYRKVEVGGSNALDFQLATYVGYMIAGKKDGQFFIVSNDRGYDYVAGYWRKQKVDIKRIAEISSGGEPEQPSPEDSDLMKAILTVTDSRENALLVLDFIERYKTKLGLHNALVKQFGNNKAGEIYPKLKPFISDKKGY